MRSQAEFLVHGYPAAAPPRDRHLHGSTCGVIQGLVLLMEQRIPAVLNCR